MPLGKVKLPVTFGEINNYMTEFLTFEVADIDMSYCQRPVTQVPAVHRQTRP